MYCTLHPCWVWERDKGICQKCRKPLYKIIDPYEQIIEELQNLHEIKIFKWIRNCWKCNEKTPIVTYDLVIVGNYHLGSIRKLDEILMQKCSFVKKFFSKTQAEDIANTCISLWSPSGKLVCNGRTTRKKADMLSGRLINMDDLVDMTLPNNLQPEDLQIEKGEETY